MTTIVCVVRTDIPYGEVYKAVQKLKKIGETDAYTNQSVRIGG